MSYKFVKSWRNRVVAIVATTALIVGVGVSVNGSPRLIGGRTADIVYSCVKNSSGAMRMVAASKPCKKGETRWQWNGAGAQGPAGATGAQGPAGATGATGAQGPAGTGVASPAPTPTTPGAYVVKDAEDNLMGAYTGTFATTASVGMTTPRTYESSGYKIMVDGVERRVGVENGKVSFFRDSGERYNPYIFYVSSDCSGTALIDKNTYDSDGQIAILLIDDGSGGTRSYYRNGNSTTPSTFGSALRSGICSNSGETGREVYPLALGDSSVHYTAPLRVAN